jgi:FKBP-type peptidyl-prolyl cis-trans isomerase SlyD
MSNESERETVRPDAMVNIKYIMKSHLPDGTIKKHPEEEFQFIFGVERQVSALESALEGGGIGQKIQVKIPSAEIYGEHDPELIREIPKKGLIKQRLKEGQFYRQMKKGCLVSFKVLEVKPDAVLVDFNKPMAGVWVSMETEILGIRKAEKREIDSAIEKQVKKSIGCA